MEIFDYELVISTIRGATPAIVNSVLALCILWGASRIFDWLAGNARSFRQHAHERIQEAPMAVAVYRGGRLLAFALVVGPIFAAIRG